jgi:hypothetical protein
VYQQEKDTEKDTDAAFGSVSGDLRLRSERQSRTKHAGTQLYVS